MNEHQGGIAAEIRRQAAWRASRALQYPLDDRNARTAAALTELAHFVESLPAGDAVVAELDELSVAWDAELPRVLRQGEPQRMLGRYGGFDHVDHDPYRFLQRLAWVARAELADMQELIGA